MPNSIPTAVRVDPVYEINDVLYRKVTNAEALASGDAIAAEYEIVHNGEAMTKRGWFVAMAVELVDEPTDDGDESDSEDAASS